MTERNQPKKSATEPEKPRLEVAESIAVEDPFDDPALDRLLDESIESGIEPRLFIVDRLLTRVRVRREV